MTLKMKAEIKQQWVDALRLGNYQQGAGELHSMRPLGFDEYDERFCCLGILGLLCQQAGFVESGSVEGDGYRISYGATCETAYLPNEVIDWAGLEFEGKRKYTGDSRLEESRGIIANGERDENYRDLSLSVMNDSGKTFEEIADAIETHVIGV